MKLILLSLVAGIFWIDPSRTKFENTFQKILITNTDQDSGRTLMIEEDEYSIWAYVLNAHAPGVDFDGFVCSIRNPKTLEIDPKEATKNGNAPPLTAAFANKYSYIENVSVHDIKIRWTPHQIEIKLKDETYLIMDLRSKTSYSKALSQNCYYGNSL